MYLLSLFMNVHAQAMNEYFEGPNVDGSCGPKMEIVDSRWK